MTETLQSNSNEYDKVAILDAGSQYAKVIDRRIRELSVYSELVPLQTSVTELLSRKYKAIIVSGSPGSVNDPNPAHYDPKLFDCGLPILGICYGLQMLNKQRGGTIVRQAVREDGQFQVELNQTECPLFKDMNKLENVLLTHGDSIEKLGENLLVVGKSESFIIACVDKEKPIYGLQFHPEVDLTDNGMQIFQNFLFDIAHCQPSFTMGNRIEEAFTNIRSFIKDQIVFILCSGGVDSSVCAALLTRALPTEQVKIVSIDNGFLRHNEGVEIRQTLSQFAAVNYIDAGQRFAQAKTFVRAKPSTSSNDSSSSAQRRISASSNFLSLYDADVLLEETLPLNEETDPEHKRKIIGDTFVKVVQEFLRDNNFTFDDIILAQGTLRPDLIESASHLACQSGYADAIKTHHNDSPMVRELRKRNRVIEPLKDFHKDEVRKIGLTLGLQHDVIYRHPFPGPGLAIRILCADEPYMPNEQFSQTSTLLRTIVTYSKMVDKQYALLPTLDKIFTENEKILLKKLTSPVQHDYTSVVLPIRSVGVQGDARTYSFAAAISSNDERPNWNELFILARLITKACHHINRVVYILGKKILDAEITQVTRTSLTQDIVDKARACDHHAMLIMKKHNAYSAISQMPVVLIPIQFDRQIYLNDHEEINKNGDHVNERIIPLTRLRSIASSFQHSVVLRTFLTKDFMTGRPAVPGETFHMEMLDEMCQTIKNNVPGISRILYDLTSKPPATTEWE
ncbi:unnamed protein product [Rotaria socialis]|uniref:GMP synthase (glutamine-hydrolyzing) n=1 Tax=Rotaria socialis TaxID=392032 RepID=A0A817UX35_9BILA|nr:unnamed protein product [Rotaria socialis]CAF3372943.1 unnamed protein product [Rotaria socialis]CAF4330174.1 unnamed protein product [Rotaria socialis]CAF4644431.1 unnamed protein product [Rotaria socialis]